MVSHINTTYLEIPNPSQYDNSILKPIHAYAHHIAEKPELKNGSYTQLLYAEILILPRNSDSVTMVSRAATQQFKLIENYSPEAPEDCYKTKFAFYVPWFLDTDSNVLIKNHESDDSPIVVSKELLVNFKKMYPEPRQKLEELWVPFFVKKESGSMKEDVGKLNKDLPIYDMIIVGER